MSTRSILDRLAEIRTSRVRAPLEVFELGQKLVESGWINKNSDQGQFRLSLPPVRGR